MIRVTTLYPSAEAARFDYAYYRDEHMPAAARLMNVREWGVEQGVGAFEPGAAPPFVAMGWFIFDSVQDFRDRVAPHEDYFRADVPRYTNVTGVVQIGQFTDH